MPVITVDDIKPGIDESRINLEFINEFTNNSLLTDDPVTNAYRRLDGDHFGNLFVQGFYGALTGKKELDAMTQAYKDKVFQMNIITFFLDLFLTGGTTKNVCIVENKCPLIR